MQVGRKSNHKILQLCSMQITKLELKNFKRFTDLTSGRHKTGATHRLQWFGQVVGV